MHVSCYTIQCFLCLFLCAFYLITRSHPWASYLTARPLDTSWSTSTLASEITDPVQTSKNEWHILFIILSYISFCLKHVINNALGTIYLSSVESLTRISQSSLVFFLARKVLVCGYSWKTLCRVLEGSRRVSVGRGMNGMCEIGLNLLEAEQFVQCSPKPISEIAWVSHLFFTPLPNCFSKIQLIHLFTVAQALKDMRVWIYARERRLDGNYKTICVRSHNGLQPSWDYGFGS